MLGGSTNAVLHLLAMARAANIELTVDDFTPIADKTPVPADLKPSGKYVMEGESSLRFRAVFAPAERVGTDLHRVGGVPSVLKYLLANTDLIDGTQLTVTGKTLSENVADGPFFLLLARRRCVD